jgi:hypothetical protein
MAGPPVPGSPGADRQRRLSPRESWIPIPTDAPGFRRNVKHLRPRRQLATCSGETARNQRGTKRGTNPPWANLRGLGAGGPWSGRLGGECAKRTLVLLEQHAPRLGWNCAVTRAVGATASMLGCILLPRSSGPGSVGSATSSGQHADQHDPAALERAVTHATGDASAASSGTRRSSDTQAVPPGRRRLGWSQNRLGL